MQQLTKKSARLFCFLALCFSYNLAFVKTLPQSTPVPGGIVDIKLPYNDKQKPEIYFQDKRVAVVFRDAEWHAFIGIPIDLKPGIYHAELRLPIQKNIAFNIKNKRFPEQHLKFKKQELVTPSEENQQRIEKENKLLNHIYMGWSNADPFRIAFASPLRGPITSEFGLRRILNGIPKSPHLGLDIAAPEGTDIKAVAPGVVVLAQSLFYTGNTVIVDHGLGVFSLYGHMSKILVTPGRHIAKDNILGQVGMTGRATGPHLHWGMILNQTKVAPLSFIKRKAIEPKIKSRRT